MIWLDIPEYQGIYKISEKGDVVSLPRSCKYGSRLEERPIKQNIKKGYVTVPLSKNSHVRHWLVHRLVAITFIKNPNNLPQINHIDGDKTNNDVKNLEWCDRSHNQVHARKLKLQGGEKTNTSKLTERCVKAIRNLYPDISKKRLSEAFEIGMPTISKIINRKYWKYI